MKLKQEFVLREVAGEHIVIPVAGLGDRFNGLLTLNETGVFIWKQLEQERDEPQIVDALLEEYEVSRETAERDVAELCAQLRKLRIL